jgi:predicted O-methyltransferase YrrM
MNKNQNIKSSYIENRFDQVLKTLCSLINPKSIVEFGILDGYSLKTFKESTNNDCIIQAFDLFDEFPYNAAVESIIRNKYEDGRTIVAKKDYYEGYKLFNDNTIDIIHIDIANDADVFKFGIEHYLSKVKDGGVLVFEGGSKDRDEVYWMNEFNKPKINPYLESIKDKYDITIIEDYPSVTIIKK